MEDKDDTILNVETGASVSGDRDVQAEVEDHDFGSEGKEFEGEMSVILRRVADDLYDSWEATIREYLANAETACLRVQEYVNTGESSFFDGDMTVSDDWQPRIHVTWDKMQDRLTIEDNGIGMSANTVDNVYRKVGYSANRGSGQYSGQLGQGALSFVKVVGVDNAMIMTTNSRITDDNGSYHVSLDGGVVPVMGQKPDDQYGTTFQMNPKDDFDIRSAVERYAQWMRVPVRYEEMDKGGEVSFQEDYGDKELYDDYSNSRICLGFKKDGYFEAYSSPDSTGRTLLLSMEIDRNENLYGTRKYNSRMQFDVRLLDESGKIVESSNGNEGLKPIPRSDYEAKLLEARAPYISKNMLSHDDVIGQRVLDSETNEQTGIVVPDDVHEKIESGHLTVPRATYKKKSDVSTNEVPGETKVLSGSHEGKTVVRHDEWEDMDSGRADQYIPEDELEDYDVDTGEGDLCLPRPTGDRDRLKASDDTFWKYIADNFNSQFQQKVKEVIFIVEDSDNPQEEVWEQLDEDEFVITPEGF